MVSSLLVCVVLVRQLINSFRGLWERIRRDVHREMDSSLKALIIEKIELHGATEAGPGSNEASPASPARLAESALELEASNAELGRYVL